MLQTQPHAKIVIIDAGLEKRMEPAVPVQARSSKNRILCRGAKRPSKDWHNDDKAKFWYGQSTSSLGNFQENEHGMPIRFLDLQFGLLHSDKKDLLLGGLRQQPLHHMP